MLSQRVRILVDLTSMEIWEWEDSLHSFIARPILAKWWLGVISIAAQSSPVQSSDSDVSLCCPPGRRRRRRWRWRWRRSGEPRPLRILLLVASAACPASLPPSLAPHHDPCRPSLLQLHPTPPLGAPSPGCASTTWPRSTAPPPRPTCALSTPSPLPSRAKAPPPSTSLQRTPLSSAAPSSPRAPSSAPAPVSMSIAPGGTAANLNTILLVLSPSPLHWMEGCSSCFPAATIALRFYVTIKF